MPFFKIQDTVAFAASAEEVVVNDSIRITAPVTALVTRTGSEESVYAEIRTVLREFIDTEWQFQNVNRSTDSTGYEQVRLDAVCRVHERENYALDKRREAVSRPGLNISWTRVDNSIPLEMLAEAESRLRRKLIEKIKAEAALINDAMGAAYRIHSITFDRLGSSPSRYSASQSMAPISAMALHRASEESGEAEPLGNAAKITMRAQVVLGIEVAEAN
jgi:hypothetical protein